MSVTAENLSPTLFIHQQELLRRPQEFGLAIDPENPVEIDDAVSVSRLDNGTFLVSLHVADAGLLFYDQETIDRARLNGWTRYDDFDRNHQLMIDPELAVDQLGLDVSHYGLGAPAVTMQVVFDPVLRRISGLDIYKSRLSCDLLTYDEFGQRYTSGDSHAVDIVTVAKLINEDVDTPSDFSNIKIGYDAVGELMVAANRLIAEEMRKHGIPWLFRNHNQKTHRSLQDYDATDIQATVYDLLDSIGRARYSSVPMRHEGLNLLPYCHFTSPLRRFADFVNHLTLHALFTGRDFPFSEAELEFISEELAQKTAIEIGYYSIVGSS